ncbi:family 20 glycosylhydrolase [Actinomycetota bacterium Odt1-20B]
MTDPSRPSHSSPLSRRGLISAIAVAGATVAVPLPMAHAAQGAEGSEGPRATRGNPRPAVVPALQEWDGGSGAYVLGPDSRVVVASHDATQLLPLAQQLARDIKEVSGIRLAPPLVAGRRRPRPGEILLRLDPGARHPEGGERYAREGYDLDVTRSTVTVTAPAYNGAYYGTRSLLQALLTGGPTGERPTRTHLPVGRARDWPNYRLRGFMLDVGRRFFTPDFIRGMLRVMGWFKVNDLQLHLNDNEIKAPGGDWSKAYDAFRLRSEKEKWEGLAAPDGAYSRADWDSFEDLAALHAVQLTPEIDAPAHSRSFVRFRPELGLGGPNSDHLDLSKPETMRFMEEVFSEFAPWFRSPEVHYGADEYTGPEEQYRTYFNQMAAHLRSLHKTPRAWGSLSEMAGGGASAYDHDVVMHSWNNGWYGPQAAKRDGYRQVVNTNDANLYIVPFADYYHGHGLDGPYLYGSWEPHVFPGTESLEPFDPVLRGAMSAVWNDLVHATYTEDDVFGLVEPTFGTLAQKMWSGRGQGIGYEEFTALLRGVSVGPGARP